MKVLVTGSSGTVGSALIPALLSAGHQVIRLVRNTPRNSSEVTWRPNGEPHPATFDGADAVIHLAGENIARGRWTAKKKAAIRESRVLGTRTVSKSIAAASNPPKVLISASGMNYYGDRGDQVLTEQSPAGTGFLADVCQRWEAETEAARAGGARVVRLRTGIVLSPRGGALQKMLLPFRMGVGGRIGSGRQWWSWITLDDQVALIQSALANPKLQGPVNAVSPNPVVNLEFTRLLGRVLRRPTVFPVPEFAVRLAFGEMGEELLLASQRVEPAAATNAGFQFKHPQLLAALQHLL